MHAMSKIIRFSLVFWMFAALAVSADAVVAVPK